MGNYKKAQSIVGTNRGSNSGIDRPELDFYPTPRRGTEALLGVETFNGDIWEPACGNGAMSSVLEEKYTVYSTDIEPRNFGAPLDFLSFFRKPTCPKYSYQSPIYLSSGIC